MRVRILDESKATTRTKTTNETFMRITITPTEHFFRTEEGWVVRAWTGETDAGLSITAFVAAIAFDDAKRHDLNKVTTGLMPIPSPEAVITDIKSWGKN